MGRKKTLKLNELPQPKLNRYFIEYAVTCKDGKKYMCDEIDASHFLVMKQEDGDHVSFFNKEFGQIAVYKEWASVRMCFEKEG